MKSKEQIAKDLREGRAVGNFILDSFRNDPKVKLLNTEKLTKSEFVLRIEPSDPYEIIELYDGKYQVMDKKLKLPIEAHIDTARIKALDQHYDRILKVYPELSEFIKFTKDKVKSGCANCNKAGFAFKILHAIKVYGGLNRDVEELVPAFGRVFIDKLKVVKEDSTVNLDRILYGANGQKVQAISGGQQLDKKTEIVVGQVNGWIRHQCVMCTGKHLSTALCLFKEYLSDKVKYSDYWWEALGEIVCAEHECISIAPALAKAIRHGRLAMMADRGIVPNLTQHFPEIDKMIGS